MATETSVVSLTLDLPPSCVAFCPPHPELFVVGTYFLHPKGTLSTKDTVKDSAAETSNACNPSSNPSPSEQKRTGSLILFRLGRDDEM